MVLRTKIVIVAVSSVFLTAAAGLAIERSVVRHQGEDMLRDTMRAVILGAENTRQAVAAMRAARVFEDSKLKAEIAKSSDYRQARIYKTVPVVAAWNSISEVAAKEGYEFRVPARNPRNAKNTPTAAEERILGLMESGKLDEYFEVDEKTNEVVYARPIVLAADCLPCHGDTSYSPTRDGRDMLGFHMEGWREGDRHGIFLLRSKLDHVDGVVKASMGTTALWLVPLAIAIGVGVYFLISNISKRLMAIVDTISESSSQVTGAVGQISRTSQALAQGASDQASSLEETSAAGEQLTAMTQKNADNSRAAAGEMDKVDRTIKESDTALNEMVASMNGIKESSGKIARIIKVIDEIAFQTNILALNAAVEAARAGSAGAGFAVVADEVRNLAQRSAQAAKDTASLIEESISKSNGGSAKLEQVSLVIRAIAESAVKVKVLVDEVNVGSQEQARGIEEISKSISQMDQVTQSNAASAEESAAASEQLAAQADSMNAVAMQLREVVAG
jgi:ABC-type transporter Mla subunit MlaD